MTKIFRAYDHLLLLEWPSHISCALPDIAENPSLCYKKSVQDFVCRTNVHPHSMFRILCTEWKRTLSFFCGNKSACPRLFPEKKTTLYTSFPFPERETAVPPAFCIIRGVSVSLSEDLSRWIAFLRPFPAVGYHNCWVDVSLPSLLPRIHSL